MLKAREADDAVAVAALTKCLGRRRVGRAPAGRT